MTSRRLLRSGDYARPGALALGAACLALLSSGSPAAAHPLVVDQKQTSSTGSRSIQLHSPVGQEFRPTFSTLQAVELRTEDGGGSGGATLRVHLRQGTIFDPILATSSNVALPEGFRGATHFDFPVPVSVVPDQLYVIEVVVVSGANWAVHDADPTSYSRGREIVLGVPRANGDLWFREGPLCALTPCRLDPDFDRDEDVDADDLRCLQAAAAAGNCP